MATSRRGRETVVIIGAGGHGKVVCDALEAAGHRLVGWIDDDRRLQRRRVSGHPVLGMREDLPRLMRRWGRTLPKFIVAIGDNALRGNVFDEVLEQGLAPAQAIHPRATIAPSVRLGRGIMVFAGAVVNSDSVIGDDVIINTAATVDHDNRIERDVHLSPGVHTGGHVHVAQGAHLGLGVVVLPRRSIGAYTIVGAGAVVDRNLPRRVVAAGVPVRILRRGA